LDDDDEVSKHRAEKPHHVLSPHREEAHSRHSGYVSHCHSKLFQ
jgi:hypothetical protein